MHYLIDWKLVFKDLFKKLLAILFCLFIVLMVIDLVKNDFNIAVAFKHIELRHIPIIFVIILLTSAFGALVVSYFSKLSSITITDNEIIGRNYFGFKKVILFSDIQKAYRQDDRGFESIVIYNGSFFQSIYFPVFIERLDEIIEKLKNKNITLDE